MAGTSKYTEAEKARVFVRLAANDGNVKRTSRELELPVTTVARWSHEWKDNPPEITEEIKAAVDDYLHKIERVRDLALTDLEEKIKNGNVDARTLATIFGILDDKVTRAKGLATARVEHQHTLPSAAELSKKLGDAVRIAIDAAGSRQQEIIDAEIVEDVHALPVGDSSPSTP